MSWLRSTASVNKIHKLNYCHICSIILILSENISPEILAKYDRGDAMEMVRDFELTNYAEDCNEVSHIIFQAEKDIKEHILDNVPSLSENSFDERIIEFDGNVKKYEKNKICFLKIKVTTLKLNI